MIAPRPRPPDELELLAGCSYELRRAFAVFEQLADYASRNPEVGVLEVTDALDDVTRRLEARSGELRALIEVHSRRLLQSSGIRL